MGIGGIGPTSLLLILIIVILLFGTKRLRSLGGDLGAALKSFRKGMNQDEEENNTKHVKHDEQQKD